MNESKTRTDETEICYYEILSYDAQFDAFEYLMSGEKEYENALKEFEYRKQSREDLVLVRVTQKSITTTEITKGDIQFA